MFYVCMFTMAFFDVPLILIGYYISENSWIWYTMAAIVAFAMLLNCIPKLNPQEIGVVRDLPTRVVIEKDKVCKESLSRYKESEIQYVKKVVDEGDWYLIVFYFPHKIDSCICQKNRLKRGSIEEFEKRFEGLIVRNYIEK